MLFRSCRRGFPHPHLLGWRRASAHLYIGLSSCPSFHDEPYFHNKLPQPYISTNITPLNHVFTLQKTRNKQVPSPASPYISMRPKKTLNTTTEAPKVEPRQGGSVVKHGPWPLPPPSGSSRRGMRSCCSARRKASSRFCRLLLVWARARSTSSRSTSSGRMEHRMARKATPLRQLDLKSFTLRGQLALRRG